MARKKKKKQVTGRSKAAVLANMHAAALKQQGKKGGLGGTMLTGKDHRDRFVGIDLPSLAMEYLLCSDKLILSMMYGIAGPRESFKSTLALALAELALRQGGVGFLAETEGGKISPTTLESTLGEEAESMHLDIVESLEDAQKYLTWALKYMKETYPDKDQMAVALLDSLNGPASEERHEKFDKAGHGSRDFAVEALIWSQWFKVHAARMVSWPLLFLFVNHEKRDIGAKNEHAKRHPGGDAQEFHATVYLSTQRTKSNETVTQDIHQLNVKTVKHSFGSKRKISLPLVVDKTKVRSRLWFDWGHATAHLLSEQSSSAVKDIAHVTTTTPSMTAATRRFSCKQVGLTQATGAELGAAVHADEKIMQQLREVLRIEKYNKWEGAMPLLDSPGEDMKDIPPQLADDINHFDDEEESVEL